MNKEEGGDAKMSERKRFVDLVFQHPWFSVIALFIIGMIIEDILNVAGGCR